MRRQWRHRAPRSLPLIATPSIDTHRLKVVGGLAAACLGFAALAGQGGQAAAESGDAQVQVAEVIAGLAEIRDVAQTDTTARATLGRGLVAETKPVVAIPAEAAPPQAPEPVEPAEPTPVAGLNQIQMNNAKRIVDAASEMGLGKRAQVIAVATAMQESTLYNLASTRLPESYNYPNEGEGSDHDSVGLFQQRTSTGWGPVKDLMRPEFATQQFLKKLVQIPGWDGLPLTVAAQRVQVSAYPDHYAKHEARAIEIVDALNQ